METIDEKVEARRHIVTVAIHTVRGFPESPSQGKKKGKDGPSVNVSYSLPMSAQDITAAVVNAAAGKDKKKDKKGSSRPSSRQGSIKGTGDSEDKEPSPEEIGARESLSLDILDHPRRHVSTVDCGTCRADGDEPGENGLEVPVGHVRSHVVQVDAGWLRRACAVPMRLEITDAASKKAEVLGTVEIDLVPSILERRTHVARSHALAGVADDADSDGSGSESDPDDAVVEIPIPSDVDPDASVAGFWFPINPPSVDADASGSSKSKEASRKGGEKAAAAGKPRLEVLLSVTFHAAPPVGTDVTSVPLAEDPLLTDAEAEVANVLEIDVGRVNPLPTAFETAVTEAGDPFRYALRAEIPVGGEDKVALTLEDGQVDLGAENGATGTADGKSKQARRGDTTETDDGDDGQVGAAAGEEEDDADVMVGPRIAWRASQPPRRLFLGGEAIEALKAMMAMESERRHDNNNDNDDSAPGVRFTMTRELVGKPAASGAIDGNALYYRGAAVVPFEVLLAPGCDYIEDAFPVHHVTPTEQEVHDLDELVASARDKSAKKKSGSAKGSAAALEQLLAPVPASSSSSSSSGETHPFDQCGCAIELRLSSYYPLVPRVPTPPPGTPTRPADLIPPRPKLPRVARTSADDEFVRRVRAVIRSLASEYSSLFSGANDNGPGAVGEAYDPDERRRRLVFELNRNGRYNAFKERLKLSVRRVVRETMRDHPSAGTDRFHNDLYVHLMRGVHRALNGYVTSVDDHPVDEWARDNSGDALVIGGGAIGSDPSDSQHGGGKKPRSAAEAAGLVDDDGAGERLMRLAAEAELFGRHADAQRQHQQRISMFPRDPGAWCDYGMFLLRRGELVRGQECLREAIAVEPECVTALVALGCTLMVAREGGIAPKGDGGEIDEHDPALVFLRGALEIDPLCVEAGVCLALYLRLHGDDAGAKAALRDVTGSVDAGKGTYLPLRRDVLGTMSIPDDPTPLLRSTTSLLLSLNLLPLALCALDSYVSLSGSQTTVSLIARSRALLLDHLGGGGGNGHGADQGSGSNAERAAKYAREALDMDPADPVAWVCLAHAVYACEGDDPAYVERISEEADHRDSQPGHKATRAKKTSATSSKKKPGRDGGGGGGGHKDLPDHWRCGSLEAYESAFSLTQQGDLVDPVAWVRLGWLRSEASHGLNGNANGVAPARDAHYRACAEWPCATAWLGVGDSYIAEGEYDLAEEALAEANTLDPRNASVWLCLSLCCISTDRASEARQCVSRAHRCGVDDAVLLQRVGRSLMDHGMTHDAEDAMRRCLAVRESSQARLDLAEVLVELGRLDEAAAELRTVVERGDRAVRIPAIRSLCAVLVSMERGTEAERYRAMLAEEESGFDDGYE